VKQILGYSLKSVSPAHEVSMRLAALVLCITLLAHIAGATTVVYAPTDVIAANADIVVIGTVRQRRIVEADNGVFGIWTEYEFTITRGTDDEQVWLRLPGGQTDTRTLVVPGVPELTVGSDYLLMLEEVTPTSVGATNGTYFVPMGLGQGVWTLSASDTGITATQMPVAVVDTHGMPLTSPLNTMPLETLWEVVVEVRHEQ